MTRLRAPLPLAIGLVLALLAGLALAACGDSGDSTVTSTTTVTTGSDTTGGQTSTGSETTGSADGETPPADIEVSDSATFVSPSGNIGCFIDKTSVRCDIGERDWKPPKPPADCQLDYGQGVTLSAGGAAELVCAGDTLLGSGGQELAYGQSISAGLLRCESSEDGMTCRDIETGRGFKLSRQSYELF